MKARRSILTRRIAQRIIDEHRKHKDLDWATLAAIKIISELEEMGVIKR